MRQLALMMGISLDGLVARSGKFGVAGWAVIEARPYADGAVLHVYRPAAR